MAAFFILFRMSKNLMTRLVAWAMLRPYLFLPSACCAALNSEEKAERFWLMQAHGITELDAALGVVDEIDRKSGIEPVEIVALDAALKVDIEIDDQRKVAPM